MRTRSLKELAACLAVVLMLCGHLALADEKPASKIDELLKRRLAVVEEARRAMSAEIQAGRLGWLEMLDATVEVLNARLDLAKSPKDRIKVFEVTLKDAENLEHLWRSRVKSGRGRQSGALRAKALVLKLQIDLERAKENLGQPTAGSSTSALSPPKR